MPFRSSAHVAANCTWIADSILPSSFPSMHSSGMWLVHCLSLMHGLHPPSCGWAPSRHFPTLCLLCAPLLIGYKYYGFNRGECNGQTGIWYREWAPGAKVGTHAVAGSQ